MSAVNIVFRTDASAQMGTGHLMRCLTLASELRERGAASLFVCRHLPSSMATQLEQQGHQLRRLTSLAQPIAEDCPLAHADWLGTSWCADAEEARDAIAGLAFVPDWLVVDHYALDARWERALRPSAKRILVIDDLGDRMHDCDCLLDQNMHSMPAARYQGKVGDTCRLLLGPRYALLRPEFAAVRMKRQGRHGAPRRVLVFMGGIDSANATQTVVRGVLALSAENLELEIVTTDANPNLAALHVEFGVLPNVGITVDAHDMAQRIAAADIAIGAGGGAMLERACLGLPTLTISIAENQEAGAESLGLIGATLYLGRSIDVNAGSVRDAMSVLLMSATLRSSLAERAAALVDGKGAERVSRFLRGGTLALRPAVAADAGRVLTWRNDERTRRYSGDDTVIASDDHAKWFAAMLADDSRKMLIVEEEGIATGVLRYDIEGQVAAVSIFLVPGNQGQGLGNRILAAGEEWLSRACPAVRELEAVVREDNVASLSVFEATGFERNSVLLRKKVTVNV